MQRWPCRTVEGMDNRPAILASAGPAGPVELYSPRTFTSIDTRSWGQAATPPGITATGPVTRRKGASGRTGLLASERAPSPRSRMKGGSS